MAKKKFIRPSLRQFEEKIGPSREWAGRCYEIACSFIATGLLPNGSHAVYGHWLGPIHEKSMFNRGLPFSQHGWVILPDKSICDPTRWVFEHAKPYVYWGPNDCYDEGGNNWRKQVYGACPAFDPEEPRFDLPVAAKSRLFVATILNNSGVPACTLSRNQLFWLANCPPGDLGEHVKNIYKALDAIKMRALVPYDNWYSVFRNEATTTSNR